MATDGGDVRVIGEISGEAQKAICIALPAFEKYGLPIDGYAIRVVKNTSTFVVTFAPATQVQKEEEGFGTSGGPVFIVEIDRSAMNVVKAYFLR